MCNADVLTTNLNGFVVKIRHEEKAFKTIYDAYFSDSYLDLDIDDQIRLREEYDKQREHLRVLKECFADVILENLDQIGVIKNDD